MIMRAWLISGIALVVLTWVLTVPWSPPDHQGAARSGIDEYRAAGFMPPPGGTTLSAEIGHDVFEIPATDAAHAAEEAAMAGMPGMAMGDTAEGEHAAPTMTMGEAAEGGHAEQTPPTMEMGEVMKGGEAEPGESAMAMAETAQGGHAEEAPAMTMDAAAKPGHGEEAEEAGHGAGGFGLKILSEEEAEGREVRQIEIAMREWGFGPGRIMLEPGETVRFVVTNAGTIPHEFMFMPPQGMAAVAYRLERADWNITEHEAIYERPIVLPGDSFEVVVAVERPGTWMFMCMFPYHMQFGMMGTAMTEGQSMGDMGGMRM